MMSLCPPEGKELAAGKDLGVDINSIKTDTFCEEAAKLKVEHDCSKLNEQDKVDCDLLKKVVNVSISSVKCRERCIDDGELFSVCQYLYASTKALSKVWGDGVVSKPTPKAVSLPAEIPKPPVGSSSKPSTIESQPKENEKPTVEAKKDDDHKDVKEAHADPQVQSNDNKNVPTVPKPKEPKTKPKNGKGGGNDDIEESAEDVPEVFDDHQYNDKKDSYYSKSDPIVENTMQDAKSPSLDDSSSSFFSYFILLSIVAIVAYLVFHNKQKILALILEGRRRQGSRRRSGGREYRKLDSNLEDTMNSESYTSGQHVIY